MGRDCDGVAQAGRQAGFCGLVPHAGTLVARFKASIVVLFSRPQDELIHRVSLWLSRDRLQHLWLGEHKRSNCVEKKS